MTTQWRVLGAPALLIALVAAAACSGGGSASPTTPSTTDTPTINIVGQNGIQAFSPNPATFGGQRVVFKNNDSVMHRVVLNDGTVDTGTIAPGATSAVVTMPGTGTNYHCSVHPGMIGSVTAASGSPPPPCQGDYCSPY